MIKSLLYVKRLSYAHTTLFQILLLHQIVFVDVHSLSPLRCKVYQLVANLALVVTAHAIHPMTDLQPASGANMELVELQLHDSKQECAQCR